jgi:alcohol dehydrogenase class IV
MAWVRGGAGKLAGRHRPTLFNLSASLGAKQSLAEIGLRESDLDRAADLAVQSSYPNPTTLTCARIRALLGAAFHGRRPMA